eukprot:6154122-Karenia_brevis.AAC.1
MMYVKSQIGVKLAKVVPSGQFDAKDESNTEFKVHRPNRNQYFLNSQVKPNMYIKTVQNFDMVTKPSPNLTEFKVH